MPEENREGEAPQPAKRWSSHIAAIAAIVAAVIPLTAAVNGCFSLMLERERYLSDLRLKYVDRALDPTKDPTYRESFFTFIVETTSHTDPLYHWARTRLENARSIAQLRERVAEQAANLSRIADLLAKEQASHMQDKAVATARELELLASARMALREKLVAENSLRHAEEAGGYRATGPDSSRALSARDASKHPSEPSISSGYVRPGFVEPDYVADSSVPTITSAYCIGESTIRIDGSRFGEQRGTVYLGFASASGVFGPPEKLSVDSWGDREIGVRFRFPENCAIVFATSTKKVWIQRPDTELSLPAEVVP